MLIVSKKTYNSFCFSHCLLTSNHHVQCKVFSAENYDGKHSASDRVCTLSWKEREKTNLTITHSHFHSTLLLSSADSAPLRHYLRLEYSTFRRRRYFPAILDVSDWLSSSHPTENKPDTSPPWTWLRHLAI